MPSHVPQREYWTGEETELDDAWTLQKGERTARCVLMSHLFGHELRLLIDGELRRSQVCRSVEEILTTHEAWKAAMIEKSWS
jgi:hypothetical protein